MRFPYTTKLAGVTFGDAQENIKRFGCADIGSYALVREPQNPYDPNAVRVCLGAHVMGYLPKPVARDLAPLMDAGRRFWAEFVCRNEFPPYDTVGLTVRIVDTAAVTQLIPAFPAGTETRKQGKTSTSSSRTAGDRP